MKYLKSFFAVASVCVMVAGHTIAHSQTYPDKPIRIIAGFPPGGSFDAFSRTIALALGERLKQTTVVENRPGAAGAPAAEYVAKSPADGYTLLVVEDGMMSIAQLLNPNLGYNSIQDFAPISLSTIIPMVLVANPSLGVKDLKSFIALAKSKPGALNYASPGTGSSPHLTFEILKEKAAIDVVHVPYKGAANVVPDLLSGRVQLLIVGENTVKSFIRNGSLVVLAGTGKVRSPTLPDTPTFVESGYPALQVEPYYGLVAPARTPKPIVDVLDREMRAGLEIPSIRAKLIDLNMQIAAGGGDVLAARIREDIARWKPIVARLGVRTE